MITSELHADLLSAALRVIAGDDLVDNMAAAKNLKRVALKHDGAEERLLEIKREIRPDELHTLDEIVEAIGEDKFRRIIRGYITTRISPDKTTKGWIAQLENEINQAKEQTYAEEMITLYRQLCATGQIEFE